MNNNLNNIALCYHGVTTNINEKSSYVSYIDDFKEQINHLEALGYLYVKPSVFYTWYNSTNKPASPIATIIFDDALASFLIAAQWLETKSIPYGIAVIGQRLGKRTPEEGYASWQALLTAKNSGLCEILHHTYNMHHFCLVNEENEIVNAPILEGPCHVDNGNFIYIVNGDTRWYWDMSFINKNTWGFPLFGTDQNNNQRITSLINFKADTSVTADRIRVWTCLHSPYAGGYNAQVQIKINGSIVANTIVEPFNYETRTQWPEREFVTIQFDSTYQIQQGNSYNIEFITQNTGNAAFLIYAIPDFTGDFTLSTTCTQMTYTENLQWPARACIILTDGTGTTVSTNEYQAYVKADLANNNRVITKYLDSTWVTRSTGYTERDNLYAVVLGGTYSNGQLADTKIKYHAAESFTAEVIRFKYASKLGTAYPLIMDIYINDVKVGRLESNWWEWNWQEVDIDAFEFISGNDYIIRFETKNENPFGQGLIRVYMDQADPPRPIWNDELNMFIAPQESEFNHTAIYEVSNPEGSDVYPDGVVIENNTEYYYIMNEPYDGPGKVFLEILESSSGTTEVPSQICYPFGSYYSTVSSQQKEDVHAVLKTAMNESGTTSGYSVWDNPVGSLKDINLQYSEYIMPRYLIEGNIDNTQIIENINIFIGYQ
jgi:hypothetical protein